MGSILRGLDVPLKVQRQMIDNSRFSEVEEPRFEVVFAVELRRQPWPRTEMHHG
jgi:hypothetical protein